MTTDLSKDIQKLKLNKPRTVSLGIGPFDLPTGICVCPEGKHEEKVLCCNGQIVPQSRCTLKARLKTYTQGNAR